MVIYLPSIEQIGVVSQSVLDILDKIMLLNLMVKLFLDINLFGHWTCDISDVGQLIVFNDQTRQSKAYTGV